MKDIKHKSAILVVFLICVSILVSYAYYRDVLQIPFVSDYIVNIKEEATEYEIYSEYMNANFDKRDDVKLVLISKNGGFISEDWRRFFDEGEVLTEEKLERLDVVYPEIEKETFRSFWQKNSKPISLEPKFDIKKEYKVIDVSKFKKDEFDSTSGAIYERYPDSRGVFKFSRIGFNKDLTEALVYVERDNGVLSSSGGTLLLEKRNGSWQIKKDLELNWIN